MYRFTDTCKHVGNFPVEIRNQPAMQVRWGFYGQCVISGSHKGKIYIWGTQTGKTLQVLRHGKGKPPWYTTLKLLNGLPTAGSQIVQTIGVCSVTLYRTKQLHHPL